MGILLGGTGIFFCRALESHAGWTPAGGRKKCGMCPGPSSSVLFGKEKALEEDSVQTVML